MTKINNGGNAYPSHGSMGEVCHEGMSLHNYVALEILKGLMRRYGQGGYSDEDAIIESFRLASYWLQAREQKGESHGKN